MMISTGSAPSSTATVTTTVKATLSRRVLRMEGTLSASPRATPIPS